MTRLEAVRLLHSRSARWRLAGTYDDEAQSRSLLAEAARSPQISLVSREFIGKVNHLQFGFMDGVESSPFVAGSTGLQFLYAAYDRSNSLRSDAARENMRSAKAQVESLRNDLTLLMLSQYLNVQRLEKKLAALDATIERDQALVRLAEERYAAGIGLRLDVARAKGLLESDRIHRVDAVINVKKACRELALTLTLPELECRLENLSESELPLPPLSVPAEERADVRSALHLVDAARAMKSASEAESLPKVHVFGDIGTFGTHIFGGANGAWTGTLGVQLSFPLYTGGLHDGHSQYNGVLAVRAEAQAEELKAGVDSQLRIAASQLDESRSAVRLSLNHVQLAEEEVKLARKRYLNGAAGGMELSNAEANLASATDLHIEALYMRELARLNLLRAIGRPDPTTEVRK